jgi:hypothetical protein
VGGAARARREIPPGCCRPGSSWNWW